MNQDIIILLIIGAFWLIVLLVILFLINAVFRIRDATEKTAREAAKQTAQLSTLNTQIQWLNNYFSGR